MGWSAAVALGMAYVVALQMLLMGLGVGMRATAMPAGPAAIFCMPSGEQPPSSPEHGHVPACCLLGCGLSGQGMAPPPAFSAVIGRDPSAITHALAWVQDAPPHAHPRMAGQARAPPRQG